MACLAYLNKMWNSHCTHIVYSYQEAQRALYAFTFLSFVTGASMMCLDFRDGEATKNCPSICHTLHSKLEAGPDH